MKALREISIPSSGRLLVAFSGGEDSLCLASLLSEIAPDRTALLYVNHGIRTEKELEEEEELNRANADYLHLPLVIINLNRDEVLSGKGGIEASARRLRYRALFRYARENGYSAIITAHHADDLAETVIMQILRGSPFHAWGGIRQRSGIILRPMLGVRKEEIREYLKEKKLVSSFDSTNNDNSYLRNHVRNRIIPLLTEENKESLRRISMNVSSFSDAFEPIPFKGGFVRTIEAEEVRNAHPISIEKTIYSLRLTDERIPRGFIEEFLKMSEKGKGKTEIGDYEIRFGPEIRIIPIVPDFSLPYEFSDTTVGKLIVKNEYTDNKTLLFDPSLFKGKLIVRKSRPTDIIELRDSFKKVRSLEKDMKIPYSIVLEDGNSIAAVFARFLGGKDRIAKRFLSTGNNLIPISICCLCEDS